MSMQLANQAAAILHREGWSDDDICAALRMRGRMRGLILRRIHGRDFRTKAEVFASDFEHKVDADSTSKTVIGHALVEADVDSLESLRKTVERRAYLLKNIGPKRLDMIREVISSYLE